MENPYSPEAIRRARKRELRTWLLILLAVTLIVGGLLLRNAWSGTRRAQIGEVSRWDKSEPFPGVTLTLEKTTISRWQLLSKSFDLTLCNNTEQLLCVWATSWVDKGTNDELNYLLLEHKVDGVWRQMITTWPEGYISADVTSGEEKYCSFLSAGQSLVDYTDFTMPWGNIYEPGEYRLVKFVSADGAPASEAQPVFATFTIK